MNWIVFFQLRTGCLAYFLPVLWIGYFDNFPTVLIRTGYLGMYQASWHLFAKWIKHNFCSMLLKPNKFIFKSPLLWKNWWSSDWNDSFKNISSSSPGTKNGLQMYKSKFGLFNTALLRSLNILWRSFIYYVRRRRGEGVEMLMLKYTIGHNGSDM